MESFREGDWGGSSILAFKSFGETRSISSPDHRLVSDNEFDPSVKNSPLDGLPWLLAEKRSRRHRIATWSARYSALCSASNRFSMVRSWHFDDNIRELRLLVVICCSCSNRISRRTILDFLTTSCPADLPMIPYRECILCWMSAGS